jgi:hypothetical protein
MRAMLQLDVRNSGTAITDPFEAFLRDDFMAVRHESGFVYEGDGPTNHLKISDARRGFGSKMVARFVRAGIYSPKEDEVRHAFIPNLNSDNPDVRTACREIIEHCAGKFAGILLDALAETGSPRQYDGLMSVLASNGWKSIAQEHHAAAAVAFAGIASNNDAPVAARTKAAYMLSTLGHAALESRSDLAKSVINMLGGTGISLANAGGDLASLREMCQKAARNLNQNGVLVPQKVRIIDFAEPSVQFMLQNTDWQSFGPMALLEARQSLCNGFLDTNPDVVLAAANALEAIGPNRTFAKSEIGLSMQDTGIVITALSKAIERVGGIRDQLVGFLATCPPEKQKQEDVAKLAKYDAALNALESAHGRISSAESYMPTHTAFSEDRIKEVALRAFGPKFVRNVWGPEAQKPNPQRPITVK